MRVSRLYGKWSKEMRERDATNVINHEQTSTTVLPITNAQSPVADLHVTEVMNFILLEGDEALSICLAFIRLYI